MREPQALFNPISVKVTPRQVQRIRKPDQVAPSRGKVISRFRKALIWNALSNRVMNHRQIALLEIHWRARRDGEGPLSVEEAGRRLMEDVGEGEAPAVDFVKGALRSFGRRLTSALMKIALRNWRRAARPRHFHP